MPDARRFAVWNAWNSYLGRWSPLMNISFQMRGSTNTALNDYPQKTYWLLKGCPISWWLNSWIMWNPIFKCNFHTHWISGKFRTKKQFEKNMWISLSNEAGAQPPRGSPRRTHCGALAIQRPCLSWWDFLKSSDLIGVSIVWDFTMGFTSGKSQVPSL